MYPDSIKNRFTAAVEQFNSACFFECHDTLEDIWFDVKGKERFFYQGLLHIAVGLYHFGNSNFRGAQSQLRKARKKLEPFGRIYQGVMLTDILDQTEPYLQTALHNIENGQSNFPFDDYPKISWRAHLFISRYKKKSTQ
ncbi:MAG: DUF309 domain-containing protein [Calditrichaceae bacterium]